ncbi:metalloprotease, partial [Salmonella enterica subsp. enterica serovar Typhimurium]
MKNKSLLLAVAIYSTLIEGIKKGGDGNLIPNLGMSNYKNGKLIDVDVKAIFNNSLKKMDNEDKLESVKKKNNKH